MNEKHECPKCQSTDTVKMVRCGEYNGLSAKIASIISY